MQTRSLPAPPSTAYRLAKGFETIAPFVSALILVGCGVCGALPHLGVKSPLNPLGPVSIAAALLVAGAGLAVLAAGIDVRRNRTLARKAQGRASEFQQQRDLAASQARNLRIQADGLALMREIHRTTGIPNREERLHRILSLLGDIFEAREVSLFAACDGDPERIIPAAALRLTHKEETFAHFNPARMQQEAEPLDGTLLAASIEPKSVVIAREGGRLAVRGAFERDGAPLGGVFWRTRQSETQDRLTHEDSGEILAQAFAKIDLSHGTYQWAATVLRNRRSVQERLVAPRPGAPSNLVFGAPLMADQCPTGVLRIRRHAGECSDKDAEALDELLCESAKHVALALKKDADDRRAITDGLTGLFIKRHFLTTLAQMGAEFADSKASFCLILCDIDHFKKVNDTHGHLTGDMVLKGVSQIIRRTIRSHDQAFRYGGEELAVLLPDCSREAALQTAERMRTAVQQARIRGEQQQLVPVTISLGVAEFELGSTGETLISLADKALYRSKQEGRNRTTCAEA